MRRDHITSWILDTTRALVPAEGPGELDLVRSDFVVGPAAADGVPRPKTARELASSAIRLGLGNYRVLIERDCRRSCPDVRRGRRRACVLAGEERDESELDGFGAHS